MASFLRHVTTMQSPENPSYLNNGPPPANDIRELRREASLENLAALQRYLEKLQFEANTLRMWYDGLQDEIMDEAQKVHLHMMRMIGELQRVTHAQPWLAQWQAATNPPQPPAAPAQVAAPTSKAASATGLPMKSAPSSRPSTLQNPSMASAPRNHSFPTEQGADPFAQRLSKL